ncbi:hypothetical protein Pint_06617 [Pistacia integerrima]|uniref:Uncharacterized protein n=1 Tax=Pistacia integerrima TaxID=434235 RepID=A0ACC0Z2A0_9ROSI|nr:hypothetical protein Pint_06617 [Pistacia integerrima]
MSPAAGVQVPLLPNHKLRSRASVSGAVFNVSTSIIGAGIMSIPATLKVLGVIPAFVMIVIIACLANISVEILMRFTHAGAQRRDVLSGNQPGGLAHLGVLQEWFGIHWWNSRAFSLLFIVVFVMLPLVLLRRVAVPVIVIAFTFHFNVHPIGFELNKPSDMILAAELCTSPYACVSLLNFSLRVNIDELLFSKKPILAKDTTRFLSITFVLLAFSYLAAIFIPDIWTFFQFLGSTSAVSLALIFPGAIVLRDVHGISTTRDRITALVMIILAVVTSAIAISTNIVSFFGNNS